MESTVCDSTCGLTAGREVNLIRLHVDWVCSSMCCWQGTDTARWDDSPREEAKTPWLLDKHDGLGQRCRLVDMMINNAIIKNVQALCYFKSVPNLYQCFKPFIFWNRCNMTCPILQFGMIATLLICNTSIIYKEMWRVARSCFTSNTQLECHAYGKGCQRWAINTTRQA